MMSTTLTSEAAEVFSATYSFYGVGNQELFQGGLAVVGFVKWMKLGLSIPKGFAQSCAEQANQIVSGEHGV